MAMAAAADPTNRNPDPLTGKDDPRLTPILAIDCEMVGVGSDGKTSVLAQVCVVNDRMETVYVTYVKPKERVTDYRTWVSGVEPKHLRKAPSFESVVKTVSDITLNRVIVGHALKNDLHAMMLDHPKSLIRDTSKYPAYRVRHHVSVVASSARVSVCPASNCPCGRARLPGPRSRYLAPDLVTCSPIHLAVATGQDATKEAA
jgi:DNA polymerase III epsilon subunit-like protein